MAGVFARVQRVSRPPVASPYSRNALLKRGIHQTPIALKKKKGVAKDDEGDLFGSGDVGESVFSDDLFAGQVTDAAGTKASTSRPAAASRKLNPEERLARFQQLHKFVADRVGQKPSSQSPQVRNAAWQHLFGLATTKEQMEQVVELFPRWRDSRRQFNAKNAEMFVRRCEELHCPTLALKVFSDHPKYGFDLSSLPVARRLLHSLHTEHPLQDSITLTALFGVYKLPAVSSDLVSCAMLTSACFKHGTQQSLTVAREMVPHLKGLLEKVEPRTMQLPRESVERAKDASKEKAWLAWTLTKIERALNKEGVEHSWLSQWRQASGHAQLATR
ncbi:hypothetical protein B0H21DRAFT_825823 [Amylocystis lapponica]|nr:hypothetical protein B0H21DRAFT_825823 [Amylocystis lapponica]